MKYITKSLSLALVLIMLVSLFTLAPITANAIRSGDFEYEFLEDGTALLTDYFGDESVLKIPMEIDGHAVGGISYELLDKCRYVTSIESDPTNYHSVDGNLYDIFETTLIKYATGKTDTHFTVPSSVTEIGYRAFYYCYNLTSVTIPSGVNVIGQEAFSGCSYLTSITIPDSVISIGWAAFDNCKSLEKVYYSGSENDWHNINIQGGDDYLKKATIYYNATEPTTPSETTEPTTEVTENTEPTETTKETQPTETEPQPTETEPTEVTMPAECAHVNTTTTGKKSATYFDKGNTGNKVCADCGEVIETGKSVAKKVLKTPKVTIKGAKNSIKFTFKKAKDATGFLVTYKLGKKTYNKKFTLSKKELKKVSVKKTISVKKSGTYKVSVRAFVTSGKKTAYSPISTELVEVK